MGLLDMFNTGDPERDQATRHGILQAGLALLQGKGNLGSILGQAGQQGLAGMQAFQGNQFQQKLRTAQLADIARKKVLEGRDDKKYERDQHLELLPSQFITPGTSVGSSAADAPAGIGEGQATPHSSYTPPTMDLAGLAQKYMSTPGGLQSGLALKSAIAPPKPMVVADNARVVSGSDPSKVILDARPDPAKMTKLAQLEAEQSKYPPGTALWNLYEKAKQKEATHAPPAATSVSVTTKQEGEEAKTVGKYFGEQYANIQTAGMSAGGKLNRLARMEHLMSGFNTGKFTPLGKEIASGAQSLGIKIDPNLGNKEAAEALSNEMALEARNPSGGAGMPGAMSDQDRKFLQNIVPGLSKTPQGNKLLIETQRRLAKRDQEVAAIAREYRKKRGNVDEGLFDALKDHAEKNPLFGDMPQGGKSVRDAADAILGR